MRRYVPIMFMGFLFTYTIRLASSQPVFDYKLLEEDAENASIQKKKNVELELQEVRLDEKKQKEQAQNSIKPANIPRYGDASYESFVASYKHAFDEIYNKRDFYRKTYQAGKKNGSFEEYIHELMYDAYKQSLRKFYPNSSMLKDVQKLKENADDLIEEYLETTCAGCCWDF